ncbi:UDP-2,3-diacylglucosamine diphosphatase [bacterium]|nr:UDP-2,3-diacylglucosamine diphosphatase [bacterium]
MQTLELNFDEVTLISDAHFGEFYSNPNKTSYFENFLDNCKIKTLLVLGDFLDFWYEYKHVIPKRNFKLLVLLSNLQKSGTEIFYLAGNHDFYLGTFFETELGIKTVDKKIILNSGNKKILCVHGDEAFAEKRYLFTKFVLRNKASNFFFRLLHPDFGIGLADFVSKKSRRKHLDYLPPDDKIIEFAQNQVNNGFDGVVAGHYHKPKLLNFEKGFYLNTGDWRKNFTFGEINRGIPQLFEWNGKEKVFFKPDD